MQNSEAKPGQAPSGRQLCPGSCSFQGELLPQWAWACPALISHGAVSSTCLAHVGAGRCIPGASLEQVNTFRRATEYHFTYRVAFRNFQVGPSIPVRFPQPKALFCDFEATQKQPPTSACLVASGRHSDHPSLVLLLLQATVNARPQRILTLSLRSKAVLPPAGIHILGGVSGGQPGPQGLGRFPTPPPHPSKSAGSLSLI